VRLAGGYSESVVTLQDGDEGWWDGPDVSHGLSQSHCDDS
jgi:hypothetical protein